MPDAPAIIAARPATIRSAVSNGSRRFLGADGRSTEARLLRDRMHALAEPHGGLAQMSEALRLVVRTAALVSVQLDGMMAAAARGEAIDGTTLAALSNQQTRLLKQLTPPKARDSSGPDALERYLAELTANGGQAETEEPAE